jgi:hypothetical protein
LWCLAGIACGGSGEDRFGVQLELGTQVVEAGLLDIRIEPGADPHVSIRPDPELEGPELSLEFWPSAPSPVITVNHGNEPPTLLDLSFRNIFPDARLIPTLRTVREPAYPGCTSDAADSRLVLAELPGIGRPIRRIQVLPCTSAIIRVLPRLGLGEAGGEQLDFAVVGEIRGNYQVFNEAVASINAWPADFTIATGNLANSAEAIDLEDFQLAAEALEGPLVTAIGPDEILGGGALAFHDIFGRSDFSFAVGDVRFFIMDTASSGMSEAQFSFWQDVLASATEPVRIAVMHTPPIDPSGSRGLGFRNRAEAARLISILGEGGVGTVLTGAVGTFNHNRLGNIDFYSTGGGGGPIEDLSSLNHHYLKVTVVPGGDPEVAVEAVEIP